MIDEKDQAEAARVLPPSARIVSIRRNYCMDTPPAPKAVKPTRNDRLHRQACAAAERRRQMLDAMTEWVTRADLVQKLGCSVATVRNMLIDVQDRIEEKVELVGRRRTAFYRRRSS